MTSGSNSVGLVAIGFTSLFLAFVTVHDTYKEWVADVFPAAWDWATTRSPIGRADAFLSTPSLLLLLGAFIAFWFARRLLQPGTVPRAIVAGLATATTAFAVLASVYWLFLITIGGVGSY